MVIRIAFLQKIFDKPELNKSVMATFNIYLCLCFTIYFVEKCRDKIFNREFLRFGREVGDCID